MREVHVGDWASTDLDDIYDHVARLEPDAADRLIRDFRGLFELFVTTPGMGQDLGHILSGMRSFPCAEYRIYYRAVDTDIEVLRVLPSVRKISPQLFRSR